MTRLAFHRPARISPPELPDQKVVLPAPPQINENANSAASWVNILLPLLSSLGMAAYMITFGRPILILLGIGFVVVSIGTTLAMRWQMKHNSRRATTRQRLRYRAHLAKTRREARQVAKAQKLLSVWAQPSPERLFGIATTHRRVWERRQSDPDFLHVRLGHGQGTLVTPLQIGLRLDPMVDYDRESLQEAQNLVDQLGKVGRQPALLDLGRAGVVSLIGPAEKTRGLARALLCQVAVLHAPGDVLIAIDSGGASDWHWATWLPHTFEPQATGEAGVVPLVSGDFSGLADFLARDLERRQELQAQRRNQLGFDRNVTPQQRRLLLVCDKFDPVSESSKSPLFLELLEQAGPQLGLTIVVVATHENDEPSRVDLRVRLTNDGSLTMEGKRALIPEPVEHASADLISLRHATLIARTLAPLTLTNDSDQVLARVVSLPELLLGADLSTADISGGWAKADDDRVLRVPIGTDGEGETVILDLKEAAQNGMGPHGLIVGATGSGKSELLRTLVTGLALTHSPELLSFVLVDFKGGATFARLTELPHVAGLITNLADDLALLDRVQAALAGEQQRRQKLLRQAGDVDSVREYQIRQAAGESDTAGRPLDPLPYLLIIVDEFGELLSRRPDFVDLFVQIGRVGRSLGMHLLLATQRLEEGRLRGLESHLSYRICLRTFSAIESRTVIGTTDAYRLPSIPGSAYLKVDESIFQRLRVAHVSAPYESPEQRAIAAQTRPTSMAPYGFRRAPEPDDQQASTNRTEPVSTGPTQMQVIIDRLKWIGEATHQVWLPPLPDAVSLDTLLGPVGVVPGRGLIARHLPQTGRLKVPVGVIDLPLEQAQSPLVLDFGGLGGNMTLVGAPQSGKSTMLRSIVMSMMLTHTPQETQFYCIDFGGGGLHSLQTAPHVGTVAGRLDPQLARRTLAELQMLMGERERMFRDAGIDSIGEFRNRRAAGRLPTGIREADVFLVIDNWGAVRTELDEAEAVVTDIAARGLGTGIHVIFTLYRWMEMRPALRESVGTRLELRLNDPMESELGRALAAAVPARSPGRGLLAPGLYFHAALPRLDGRDTLAELREAQDDALGKITAGWSGPPAPPVRMLPERITIGELARLPVEAGPGVPIGLAEHDLQPVRLDLMGNDPHLLVIGEPGSGKTSFLRTWIRAMAAAHSPFDIRLILVDFRRSLIGAVEDDYIGAYAGDSDATRAYIEQVIAKLRERRPSTTVTQQELRNRSWWEGPELYVVVDDYDLVGGNQTAPLAGLAEFLAQGREVGLHLVLARRTGGMTRTLMSDPLMVRLREVSASGLLLSGDPKEGLLIGEHRAAPRPPGRGMLVRRSAPSTLVHVAIEDDDAPVPDDNAESSQRKP